MISFQNFSFRYEESKDFTLRGIDMTVQTGEFILLTGRSGCGKTTLIRSLNGLIPHFYPGEIQGDLVMDGHSLLEMKPAQLAGQVGTVFQDPRSQFFMTDTTRELAFGCENMGLPREETIDRIAKAAKDLELADYLNRSIFALSSGEKQQIAVGSVYALSPKVYIFDEPSANLDYAATKRLAEIMGKLKRDGYTIFVVEHRFYYLRDLIDRGISHTKRENRTGIYKGAVLFLTGGNAHILWAADCISGAGCRALSGERTPPHGETPAECAGPFLCLSERAGGLSECQL